MRVHSTQHLSAEDATALAEMKRVAGVALATFPEIAFAQTYLLARFLRSPETFARNKRLLEILFNRTIDMTAPYTKENFDDDIQCVVCACVPPRPT